MKPTFSASISDNTKSYEKTLLPEKFVLAAAKAIRVVTIPHLFAFIFISLLYILAPQAVGGTAELIVSYACLTGLPLLSYPLHALVPALKRKGRKAQRGLAIVFSVIGYVAGFVFAIATHAPKTLTCIFLTYLITGIFITLFSFVMKFKASGHASGICGPVTTLCLFVSPYFAAAYLIAVPVMWCSLRSGRHTAKEFFVGCLCPVVALIFALLVSAVL